MVDPGKGEIIPVETDPWNHQTVSQDTGCENEPRCICFREAESGDFFEDIFHKNDFCNLLKDRILYATAEILLQFLERSV